MSQAGSGVVVGAGVVAGTVAVVRPALVEIIVLTAQESGPPVLLAQQSLAEFNVPENPALHLQSERASAPVLSLVNKLLVISVLELSGQSVQACDPASGLYLPSAHAVQPLSGPVYPDAHDSPGSVHAWQLGVTVELLMLHMQTICLDEYFLSLHVAALKPSVSPRKSVSVFDVSLPHPVSTFRLPYVDMRARRHVVPTSSLHT